MFVSALGAEFILRMSLAAWRQNRLLATSPSATAYDAAMAAGETILAGVPAKPVASAGDFTPAAS